MFKKIMTCLFISFVIIFTSCGAAPNMDMNYAAPSQGESYLELEESNFINSSENNKVNISMDSSSAAYSNLRRIIKQGATIYKNLLIGHLFHLHMSN